MKFSGSFTATLLIAAFAVSAMPVKSFAEGTIDGELGYDKGLYYRTEDGRFKIKQNFRIQFRTDIESTNGDGSDTETDFMIRRLKLKYGGHAYKKWLQYEFQLAGVVGRGAGENELKTEDAFIVFAKNPAADLKVGRYKLPYEREVLNSSASLQFVDRSHVKEFVIDEERGDGFSVGGVLGRFIAYRAGLFQKDGEEFKGGDNMLFAGRVQANICCGWLKYSSGSFTSGGDYKIATNFSKVPVIAFGVGGFYYNAENAGNQTHTVGSATVTKNLDLNSAGGITIDLNAKYEWASFEAAFYYGSTKSGREGGNLGDDNAAGGTGADADTANLSTNSDGNFAYRVQGGFFFTPELELATRWAYADYDKNSGERDEWQWSAALNYYIAKHRAKVQFDYTYGNERNGIRDGKDKTTNTFRAQVQVYL